MADIAKTMASEVQSDDGSSSGSEIGLQLDCHFSDFEEESEGDNNAGTEPDVEGEPEPEVLGLEPYQFEPVRQNVGLVEHPQNFEEENRMERLQGTETWCTCGQCTIMPTARECVCCHEVTKIDQRRKKGSEQPSCITEVRGFPFVCLDHDVLLTAYYQFNQEYEDHDVGEDLIHEQYRYIAYRQLVRWCWGFLGRHVRVVLPSCAVQRIRSEFPADGQYTGFKLHGEN